MYSILLNFHSLKVVLQPIKKVSDPLYAVKITLTMVMHAVMEAALIPDPDPADQLSPTSNGGMLNGSSYKSEC